ncbi:MAG: MFS transporter, partial [Phycisphaerae bacterium]|nr:MFS transporter [Phycisphaerae bacterium]
GIVGAGGNAAAFAAGFMFKRTYVEWSHQLLVLGVVVSACSFLAWGLRFSESEPISSEAMQSLPDAVDLSPSV